MQKVLDRRVTFGFLIIETIKYNNDRNFFVNFIFLLWIA